MLTKQPCRNQWLSGLRWWKKLSSYWGPSWRTWILSLLSLSRLHNNPNLENNSPNLIVYQVTYQYGCFCCCWCWQKSFHLTKVSREIHWLMIFWTINNWVTMVQQTPLRYTCASSEYRFNLTKNRTKIQLLSKVPWCIECVENMGLTRNF